MASRSQLYPYAAPMVPAVSRPAISVPITLLTVLFYLLLIPEQANMRITGILFSPYRLFLIPCFYYLLRSALANRFRFAWPDVAIMLACLWIWIAAFVTGGGIGESVKQGGAHTIDIALAYFASRFAIRSPRDFRVFLVLIAPGVALMGAIVFIESISGRIILQEIFAQVTGGTNRIGAEVRMGLVRGVASFPHPILAGICLGSFLTLYALSDLRGWPRLIGIGGAIAAFFTFSSAAILSLVVGAVLLVYEWLTQRVAILTWRLFIFGASIIFFTVESASNSGFFNLMVRYASLNTVSAYNRVLIWRFGTESVEKHPWFGIGYEDWERPAWMQWSSSFSVDNFWLLQTIRFGLPLSVCLAFATAAGVLLVASRSSHCTVQDGRLLRGLTMSLAVFALGAISVSLWLNALVWFFMLAGMAVSLGTMPVPQKGRPLTLRVPYLPPGTGYRL